MATTQGKARCVDGTQLFFRVDGKSGAPRIVLVHSLAMDYRFWQPVVERLADDAEILTYDCRGHGQSDKPKGPYTTALFALDLANLLDHLGWSAATIAGASMGGSISLAFASKYHARTQALGLVDTTAWYGAGAPAAWAARADKALQEGLSGLVDFQKTRWFGDQFRNDNPDVVQRCVDIFLANDIQAYAETCKMLGVHNVSDALVSITCPTTVIVGEEDYATPVAMAEALHQGIKYSKFLVIEKARHLTPLEVPDLIADELQTLIKEAGI